MKAGEFIEGDHECILRRIKTCIKSVLGNINVGWMDIDDLVQEVFITGLIQARRLNGSERQLSIPRMARSRLIDVVRRENNACMRESDLREEDFRTIESLYVADAEQQHQVEHNQTLNRLGRSFSTIPFKLQETLYTRICLLMTYEQGADLMGVPLGTYKNIMFRGRESLREAKDGPGELSPRIPILRFLRSIRSTDSIADILYSKPFRNEESMTHEEVRKLTSSQLIRYLGMALKMGDSLEDVDTVTEHLKECMCRLKHTGKNRYEDEEYVERRFVREAVVADMTPPLIMAKDTLTNIIRSAYRVNN